MNSSKLLLGASLTALLAGRVFAASPELVDEINPLIGATTSREAGEGKTFPGPCTPFGLVQLSPDTMTGGDNGAGYSYDHTTIEGFSFTHMSGVGWYGDLGNFLVTPTTGPLKTSVGHVENPTEGYRSPFRHETEEARVGYYAVTLDRYGIRAELAAAPHAGILRFTFPENQQSRIQIDLARRVGGTSTRQSVRVVGPQAIEGWMKCPPDGGGWGNGNGKADYTVYFHAEFSAPLTNFGIWSANIPDGWTRKREEVTSDRYRAVVAAAEVKTGCRELEGKHLGFYSEFATRKDEQVLLKVGISFVSIEGARANLAHDIIGWNFDTVRANNRALWRKALGAIDIKGGTEAQRQTFATAMYHAQIDPRTVSDVDGTYFGPDKKAHQTKAFAFRTIFSGWDVFRSEFPLLTIIRPIVINDEVNSLLQVADLTGDGFLPRWEFMGVESGCMIGDPAISVIAEAWRKNIRGFDGAHAYAVCRESAIGPRSNRKDLAFYNEHGWVPDSISWTLENAYFDHCVGRFAAALDKTNDVALFNRRAENYRTIYDPAVGNMHARNEAGDWTPWKGPAIEGQGCVESDPYQQGWFVPHDVPGLVELMGKERFVAYLNDMFEKTPANLRWNNYYNHANEPVHHVPYLFACAGAPWLTQKWVRFILDHAYGPGVGGLCGNDDCGQMSAWYVLSALGFHPVSPVDGIYILGSPLFPRATIRLDSHYARGGTFTVVAENQSPENIYVQSAMLNDHPLNRAWITHDEIIAGGTLTFVLGPQPNKTWGAAADAAPPSFTGP